MSPTWGSVMSSTNVVDRSHSPTADSISSICSFSSEDLVTERNVPSSALSPETSGVGVIKHAKWYFEDAMVKLFVDGVLYNVPRTLLTRHSTWFRERFTQSADCLPPGWQSVPIPNGCLFVNHDLRIIQDAHPGPLPPGSVPDAICLYEATSFEFDALLSVLCPDDFDFCFTKEQWIAVLKLGTLWRFPRIRALAIKRLGPVLMVSGTPLERLILARAHNVEEWIDEAIHWLIVRDEPLNKAEIARLSAADVARIFAGYTSHIQTRTTDEWRAEPAFTTANTTREDTLAEASGEIGVEHEAEQQQDNAEHCEVIDGTAERREMAKTTRRVGDEAHREAEVVDIEHTVEGPHVFDQKADKKMEGEQSHLADRVAEGRLATEAEGARLEREKLEAERVEDELRMEAELKRTETRAEQEEIERKASAAASKAKKKRGHRADMDNGAEGQARKKTPQAHSRLAEKLLKEAELAKEKAERERT